MWNVCTPLAATGLIAFPVVLPAPLAPQTTCPENAVVEAVGLASAGSRGLLELDVEGAPVVGGPFQLRVRNAPPNAAGQLRLERSTGPLSASPPLQVLRFTTDARGASRALLPRHPVSPALCGVAVTVRATVSDAAAGRAVQSQGIRLRFGRGGSGPLLAAAPAGPSIGANHLGVEIGDLDGDQVPDLAVAALGSRGTGESVYVLTGNGDGTFEPAIELSTGAGFPGFLALGDLDDDGREDIVTTGDGLAILLGDPASPGFLPPKTFPERATAVTVADMNGDGRNDVVYTRSLLGDYVRILLGQGGGSFAPTSSWPAGIDPIDVVAADLDQDGVLDLATANRELDGFRTPGAASVLLGDGLGGFLPVMTMSTRTQDREFNQALRIEVGDLDLDGVCDLVVLVHEPDTISIFRGLGAGAFALPWNRGAGPEPWDLALVDVDRDLDPDVVLSSPGRDSLRVLPGAGDGTLLPFVSHPVGRPSWFLEAADLDGDRMPDLVFVDELARRPVFVRNGTLP